jgi:hypothetical protein
MGMIINAVLLYVLVTTLGDSSEASTRWKVLVIAVGVAVGEAAVSRYVSGLWWAIALIVLSTAIVASALELWCKLARAAALKVAAIFMGVRIALAAILIFVASRA